MAAFFAFLLRVELSEDREKNRGIDHGPAHLLPEVDQETTEEGVVKKQSFILTIDCDVEGGKELAQYIENFRREHRQRKTGKK